MKIDGAENMFIYMAKTGMPVKIPLSPFLLNALQEIYVADDYLSFGREMGH
jgi:hypothetical protein